MFLELLVLVHALLLVVLRLLLMVHTNEGRCCQIDVLVFVGRHQKCFMQPYFMPIGVSVIIAIGCYYTDAKHAAFPSLVGHVEPRITRSLVVVRNCRQSITIISMYYYDSY